jgi:hypothetical protein
MSKMTAVKYEDLSAAFDFVSFGASMEHEAYISLDTGAIYWISELNPLEEDVPADLETSDRYIAVPHKNELDLGSRLALDFIATELPDQYDTVQGYFRHRGAYGRFKELLSAHGCLEKWYAFEAESTKKALKNWCSENGIAVVENASNSA